MSEINWLAVLAAGVAAFVAAGAYYAALGGRLAALSPAYADGGSMPPWKVGAELLRGLVVAAVVAGLATHLPTEGWGQALLLGLVLWIGFPVVLLTGSVVHENVPPALAAIHAGDWLVKLLLVASITGLWR